MPRTQLVVADENVLGYIDPETPNVIGILHASILRGATISSSDGWMFRSQARTIRLATTRDFDEFRVAFVGYDSNRYEWS